MNNYFFGTMLGILAGLLIFMLMFSGASFHKIEEAFGYVSFTEKLLAIIFSTIAALSIGSIVYIHICGLPYWGLSINEKKQITQKEYNKQRDMRNSRKWEKELK